MKANLHSIQQYPSLSHSSYKVILKLHCQIKLISGLALKCSSVSQPSTQLISHCITMFGSTCLVTKVHRVALTIEKKYFVSYKFNSDIFSGIQCMGERQTIQKSLQLLRLWQQQLLLMGNGAHSSKSLHRSRQTTLQLWRHLCTSHLRKKSDQNHVGKLHQIDPGH